jgi:hypothetical protein
MHQCRWGYQSIQDLTEVTEKYRKLKIPCDTIWSDIDYMESIGENEEGMKISTQRRIGPSNVLILSPFKPTALIDNSIAGSAGFSYTAEAMALAYTATVTFTLPALPLINSGKLFSETIPSPSQAESSWTGEPKPLEEIGIYRGHAWYMTGFSCASPVTSAALHIDSGSDIVSVYLNGYYIGTVLPTGRAIDLALPGSLVLQGENSLVFRSQIWGHSIYHVPTMPGAFEIPTIVLDSKRGLFGKAWVKLGGTTTNLTEWKALPELGGERDGYPSAEYDTSSWQTIAQPITSGTPLALQDGQTLWYRAQFSSSSLPDPESIFAPALIKLTGINCMATIWFNNHLIGVDRSSHLELRQGSPIVKWLKEKQQLMANIALQEVAAKRQMIAQGLSGMAGGSGPAPRPSRGPRPT